MSDITDNLTFVKQSLQTDDVITKSYHFSFISFISSDFPKIFSEKLITDKNLTQFLAIFATFVMTFECFCHIVSHLSDHLSVQL